MLQNGVLNGPHILMQVRCETGCNLDHQVPPIPPACGSVNARYISLLPGVGEIDMLFTRHLYASFSRRLDVEACPRSFIPLRPSPDHRCSLKMKTQIPTSRP
jgi:hypothetical protein